MKKKVRWLVVGVICCLISIWMIMLCSDFHKIKNNEKPLFCFNVERYHLMDPNIYAIRYKGIIYNIDEVTICDELGCIVLDETYYTVSFLNKKISKVIENDKDNFYKKYYGE